MWDFCAALKRGARVSRAKSASKFRRNSRDFGRIARDFCRRTRARNIADRRQCSSACTTQATWPCASFLRRARALVAKITRGFAQDRIIFCTFRSHCAIFGAERARMTRHMHSETIQKHDVASSVCIGLLRCFETQRARVARKICVKVSPKLARFRPHCA